MLNEPIFITGPLPVMLMRVKLVLILSILCSMSVAGQAGKIEAKRDSAKTWSEIRFLEQGRLDLAERSQKLKNQCREDSINTVTVKRKMQEIGDQMATLKKEIADLENTKDKTKDQKQFLKDLKRGIAEIQSRLTTMGKEQEGIEINHKESLLQLALASNLEKDIDQQILQLRQLLVK
jgi:septal ring factor EnvC (AmiA/AmiB activator)